MEAVKVVIRYLNGRIIKGFTNDFFPNKPVFHLRPADSKPSDKGVEISVPELKAIFFVKDFAGNPPYNEKKAFGGGPQASGRRVEVIFSDGEVLVGVTLGYDPNRMGFFVTPVDTDSNNLRVFVVSKSVARFRYL